MRCCTASLSYCKYCDVKMVSREWRWRWLKISEGWGPCKKILSLGQGQEKCRMCDLCVYPQNILLFAILQCDTVTMVLVISLGFCDIERSYSHPSIHESINRLGAIYRPKPHCDAWVMLLTKCMRRLSEYENWAIGLCLSYDLTP